jgi:hypothetical protein
MDLLRLLANPLKILCRFGWHNRLDPIYSTTCDMGAGLVRHREICPRCFTVLVDSSWRFREPREEETPQ